MEKEFYIGYLPNAPEKTSRFIRNIIICIFLLMMAGGSFLAMRQRQFSSAVFEYGSNKVYTGIYSNTPIPSVRIINQKDTSGKLININIPLVGYGKHGAHNAIESFENQNAVSLNNKLVTFKGDLIYGEGKILLSLNKDTPIMQVTETNNKPTETTFITDTTLKGEILDPKCYFGVMKPGLGKIHRECAIRCISGGIPPVFRTIGPANKYIYYLLLGKKGEPINQQVLPFVADQIQLKGSLFQWQNWMILQCDMNEAVRTN